MWRSPKEAVSLAGGYPFLRPNIHITFTEASIFCESRTGAYPRFEAPNKSWIWGSFSQTRNGVSEEGHDRGWVPSPKRKANVEPTYQARQEHSKTHARRHCKFDLSQTFPQTRSQHRSWSIMLFFPFSPLVLRRTGIVRLVSFHLL